MDFKTNAIYCGDCKDVLINHIPDNTIDLVYSDPPFFTSKQYAVIWDGGYERSSSDRSYVDSESWGSVDKVIQLALR